ncbi:hypothetical protein [Vibrio vulnificus]|uniref:hypothetical protein n=1 Tax=Vibrio vulnificus TaxID=672 RepID=UPI0005FABDF7|nr:hypothetical protein [Vibrio vulnificus]
MRLLTSVALVSVIFLSGFAPFVALKTVPQLNFASKGMDWQWHWAYFLPFSNGIQQTRTQDTKQLLLRRVYLEDDIAVFVSTTLDNKFEIDVFKAAKCNASSSEWASVSVNGAPMTQVPLKCEPSGDGYLFRHVANKLKSLEFGFEDGFIIESFAQWPINEIKADQFKQQHPTFFKKQGVEVELWLRD